MSKSSLDGERIQRLVEPIMLELRQHYIRGPVSRDRVYEALNALGICAGWVIRGTGADGQDDALEFFSRALNMSLEEEIEE